MKKILLAYLFLLIDLEIVVNMGYFGVFLPFISSCLLLQGFSVLCLENERFEECNVVALLAMLGRLVLFVLQIMNVLQEERAYGMLAALLVLVFFFVITNTMLVVFREIEQENHLFAASGFCIVGEICLLVIGAGCVWGSVSASLGVQFIASSVIASVLFLLTLYQLQVVYTRFEKMI